MRRLADAGWRRVSLVSIEGEFSARGDVLDLFPPGFDTPLRLEFFGDELEALRRFDPSTQRALETLPEVRLPLLDLSDSGADGCALPDHFDADATLLLVDPERMDPGPPDPGGRPGAALSSGPGGALKVVVRQVEPVGSDVESLKTRIREVCAPDRRTFFVCRNEAEEQRIRHLLAPGLPPGLSFLRGRLSRSFQLPESNLCLLGYDDLLEHLSRRRPPPRRVASRAIDDFLDLAPAFCGGPAVAGVVVPSVRACDAVGGGPGAVVAGSEQRTGAAPPSLPPPDGLPVPAVAGAGGDGFFHHLLGSPGLPSLCRGAPHLGDIGDR